LSSHDIAAYWPFSELPAAAGELLSAAALSLELEPEQWLFHEGDSADALFVLVEGQLDVYQGQPEQWRKRLEAGACIGELPLVVGGRRVRTGSIRAVGACKLLGLSYTDIRRLLTRKVFDSLLTPVTQRHLAQLEFGLTNLFGPLPLPVLVEIEAAMVQRHLRSGELLFQVGDSLEYVWLIDDGRLEVLIERDGALHRVAELGAGQPVGELAVLVGGERTATVRALRDTWLRGLSAATFEALLMRHPGAALGLARTLARRLMRANQQPVVIDMPRTITLLPIDDDIDLLGFANALVAQLDARATVLDHDAFVRDAPTASGLDDDPSIRRFGVWLSSAEEQHDAVLLLGGARPDGWTRACVDAADELVLVAAVDSDAGLNEVERALQSGELTGELISLVLCHPPATPIPHDPRVLEPWTHDRPKLVFLHQIARGDRRDFSQLGRGLFRR
jgi:CRP-like cAMP-binding protein